MRGYLYAVTNPHMPGLIKIGCTDRSPELRALELSQPTGVPGHYRVERCWLVDDAATLERRVHAAFAAYRIRGSEHFRLPLAAAFARIESLLPEGAAAQPAWHRPLERIAAGLSLIITYWPAIRRLHRQLRAAIRAGF
jgi:hypothetical protein